MCVPAFGIHNTFQENDILTGLGVYPDESIFEPPSCPLQFVYIETKHSHTGKGVHTLSQWRKAFLSRVSNFVSVKLISRGWEASPSGFVSPSMIFGKDSARPQTWDETWKGWSVTTIVFLACFLVMAKRFLPQSLGRI